MLKYGAALQLAGRTDEAALQVRARRTAGQGDRESSEMHYWITRLRFYALSQLGHLSLSNHNNITAVTHYEQARSVGRSFDWYERLPDGTKELQPHRIHKGVVRTTSRSHSHRARGPSTRQQSPQPHSSETPPIRSLPRHWPTRKRPPVTHASRRDL